MHTKLHKYDPPRKMQMACIYTHQSPAISGGRNVPQKNRHRSVALCKKLSCSRISENVRESVGTSSSSSSRMVTDISIKRDLGKGTDNNRRRLTSTTTSSLLLFMNALCAQSAFSREILTATGEIFQGGPTTPEGFDSGVNFVVVLVTLLLAGYGMVTSFENQAETTEAATIDRVNKQKEYMEKYAGRAVVCRW